MAERVALIVLLVEDRRQENLLRRYLERCDHGYRSIRVEMSRPGQGSGEQFVRERYASEVRKMRWQLTKTKACLIVMIDADTGSVDDRRQQLERALRDADESPRSPSEPVLNLIPKRNVETWILCLNAEAVGEATDYRHDTRVNPQTIKDAATALFWWTRPNTAIPAGCVPSLRDCLPEFDRVPIVV